MSMERKYSYKALRRLAVDLARLSPLFLVISMTENISAQYGLPM